MTPPENNSDVTGSRAFCSLPIFSFSPLTSPSFPPPPYHPTTPSSSTHTHSWVRRNGYSAHGELGNRHTAVFRFERRNLMKLCAPKMPLVMFHVYPTVVLCEQATGRHCCRLQACLWDAQSSLRTTGASLLNCHPGRGGSSKTLPLY